VLRHEQEHIVYTASDPFNWNSIHSNHAYL